MEGDAFSSLSLKGKAAVVTGSASGIGRATATLLARRGASVVIADLDAEGAETVAATLRSEGLSSMAVEVDVTHEPSVEAMVARVCEEFGGVDILHNNAALMSSHDRDDLIVDLNPEDFLRVLAVNLVGYMTCAKHVLPSLVSRGGGVIVNTASLAGSSSSLSRPMYGASKSGVIGLTRGIATQYGKSGVRCLSVSPGLILTELSSARIPRHTLDGARRHVLLDRLGQPSDVAQLVAFLVSDAGSFLTGIDIALDGGMSAHLATFADELEARQRDLLSS